jgi:hypothetical protein
MSDSKLDKTETASAIAGLVAGLGAVLGVTSVNVRAAEPPATGAAVQQNLPAATARQDKGTPVRAIARQDKIAPIGVPVLRRGVPNATVMQARPPVATGQQGKIAPQVSAVAVQEKPWDTRVVNPRAVPNARATPAAQSKPVDVPKNP